MARYTQGHETQVQVLQFMLVTVSSTEHTHTHTHMHKHSTLQRTYTHMHAHTYTHTHAAHTHTHVHHSKEFGFLARCSTGGVFEQALDMGDRAHSCPDNPGKPKQRVNKDEDANDQQVKMVPRPFLE